MPTWFEVKSFSNRVQAELAKSALESAGIEVLIQSDDLGGTAPYLGMLTDIRLLVPKEHAAEAKKLLLPFKD